MRITILGLNYSPEPSGNAPYTSGLAEGLREAGHKVHVITGYPHYPEWRLRDGYTGLTSKEEIGGIPVTRVRHFIPRKPTAMSRLIMEFSFGLRLILARWHSPDVVLLVSPALFSSGLALLKAKFGAHRPRVGIWVQDIYSHGVVETGTGGHRLSQAMSMVEGFILRSRRGRHP
jgi:colanic acid biosynthesis glycosyl transferase WcaI